MSKNEFDELLLKKLQEEELEYNPAHWDRLTQLLPPTLTPPSANKGKKWAIAAGVAAAVALALATVFFIKLLNHTQENDSTKPTIAKQQPGTEPAGLPANTPATQPGAVQSAAALPHTSYSAPAAQQSQHIATQSNPANRTNTISNNHPALNNNPIVLPDVLQPAHKPQEPLVADKKTTQEPAVKEIIPESSNNNIAKPFHKPETAPAYADNLYSGGSASAFYEGRHPERGNKKTSISLGGGVNYGNLNTGYTAGVSVRRKVGGDFFVDGAVAMLYNNNANNVAINNGPPLADNTNSAARPNSFNNETSLASPALDPIQKLYYVQFNPSVGYQVEKHVALSVGGDFQQILNSRGEQDEIVQPGTNSSKVFPNFDVGFTAKSEFSITPSIQAGLVYREGLNNMLKAEGSKYVNRRYIQVQFKYNIPVN